MLGPPAASIPRQGDGEPDRRGGQRQLDQGRLPHGQQPVQARAHGRERWWRTIAVDLREPDYDSLSAEDRAALGGWRAGQIPGELALVNRFVRDVRKHGGWAKASRASGYYTAEDLDAFFDEYSGLLARYGHGRQDAPPGARLMQLRMFYIPDEPAEPEP
jgi:hypothetical protein